MVHRLFQGDCLDVLPTLSEQFDCVFADPPDNIGLGYENYNDKKAEADYVEFLDDLVTFATPTAPIVWISFNSRWMLKLGHVINGFLERNKDWEWKPCVQVFTFGQNNRFDLGNNHRPLWRLKRKDAPLYPEQIKVPSWRERNGDKRAKPGGRVPGDVFDMQPKSPAFNGLLTVEFDGEKNTGYVEIPVHPGDVFDFPRVTGNSKQRCDWHPTQLHEELVERCIKMSTKEGGKVLDPFGGTGTTLRVCKKINRSCTLIELDSSYCEKIREAHPELTFKKLAD